MAERMAMALLKSDRAWNGSMLVDPIAGMRDVLKAMRKPIDGLGDKIGWSHSGEEAEEAWEQMIDAALGEEGR